MKKYLNIVFISVFVFSLFFNVSKASTWSGECLDFKSNMSKGMGAYLTAQEIANIVPDSALRKSINSDIAQLQDFLIETGYGKRGKTIVGNFLKSDLKKATGYFDGITEAAVKNYQKAKGLKTSGQVLALTRAAIKADTCANTSTTNIGITLTSISSTRGTNILDIADSNNNVSITVNGNNLSSAAYVYITGTNYKNVIPLVKNIGVNSSGTSIVSLLKVTYTFVSPVLSEVGAYTIQLLDGNKNFIKNTNTLSINVTNNGNGNNNNYGVWCPNGTYSTTGNCDTTSATIKSIQAPASDVNTLYIADNNKNVKVSVYGQNLTSVSKIVLTGPAYSQDISFVPVSSTYGYFISPVLTDAGSYSIGWVASNYVTTYGFNINVIGSNSTTPSITVLSPNGGETLNEGTVVPITWKSTGLSQTQNINISLEPCTNDKGCTSVGKTIATNIPNSGTYNWNVQSLKPFDGGDGSVYMIYPNGKYRINVSCNYSEGSCPSSYNADESDNYFTITNSTTSTQTIPSAPLNLTANGNTKTIMWDFPASNGGLDVYNMTGYKIYRDGVFLKMATVFKATLSYWDDSAIAGNSYTYQVSAVNMYGEGPKSNSATMNVPSSTTATQTCSDGSIILATQSCPNISTIADTTPRIMFWPGKVNQHVDSNGVWQTDPDGKSGSYSSSVYPNDYGDRKLEYCKKWYPNTVSVSEYKTETINTWKSAGNTGNTSGTKQSYQCVQSTRSTRGSRVLGDSAFQFSKTLKKGMSGEEVLQLQKFLNTQGFTIEETGYFGKITKSALVSFQEKYIKEILEKAGLKNGTGILGNNTIKFINDLIINNTNISTTTPTSTPITN